MTIEELQRFQRLAALELPKESLKDRAEPLGGDRVQDLTHVSVTRDSLNPVDGMQIVLDSLLVKGKQRGGFHGKHRKRGHQGIR